MSKRTHQANRTEIRQRYVGSEVMASTFGSTKTVSSGIEHSSMSSVNGNILDNVSASTMANVK